MELHTLGGDGGYSQRDVTEVAVSGIGGGPRGASDSRAGYGALHLTQALPEIRFGRPAGDSSTDSHPATRGRRDLVDYTHLARLPERILVFAQILLRHAVDVLVGALLGDFADASADLQVAVRVVGIHDRERDASAQLHVLVLPPAAGAVHDHAPAIVVYPYWRHLRRSIGHHRR